MRSIVKIMPLIDMKLKTDLIDFIEQLAGMAQELAEKGVEGFVEKGRITTSDVIRDLSRYGGEKSRRD